MRAVHKYELTEEIIAPIEKFLRVEYQNSVPCAWAIINTDLEVMHYTVLCSATDWPLFETQTKDNYIDTIVDGPHEWHFFAIPVGVTKEY